MKTETDTNTVTNGSLPPQDAALAQLETSHRARTAGMLRMGSHGMLALSGFGCGAAPGNPFRAASGLVGASGAAMLATFAQPAAPPQIPLMVERFRPRNVIDAYADISTTSALCLIASGLHANRKTEMLAGAWTASAFVLKRVLPEKRRGAPSSHAHGEDAPGFIKEYIDEVRHRPVKLASDMLQVGAGLVILDAVMHRDLFRGISGGLLMGSNYSMREIYKADYENGPHARS